MDPMTVQLIGVFPTVDDEPFDAFVYSMNAPTNLFVRQTCEDGSKMSAQVMAMGLNRLMLADAFGFNEFVDVELDGGTVLRFQVGELLHKTEAGAHQAMSESVRLVSVGVMPGMVN